MNEILLSVDTIQFSIFSYYGKSIIHFAVPAIEDRWTVGQTAGYFSEINTVTFILFEY